jgi:hypothetical protein
MAYESQFKDKQKCHSAPKQTPSHYRSLEQLTVYNMITINNLICLMIYILKLRAQNLLVWNNAPPHIRKPPIIGDLSLIIISCSVVLLYCCIVCHCYACCILDVVWVILTCVFLCLHIMYIADCCNILLGCFDPSTGLLNVNKNSVSNSNTQRKSTTTRNYQPHAVSNILSTNQPLPEIINHIG